MKKSMKVWGYWKWSTIIFVLQAVAGGTVYYFSGDIEIAIFITAVIAGTAPIITKIITRTDLVSAQ